jgi:hypothetical protein
VDILISFGRLQIPSAKDVLPGLFGQAPPRHGGNLTSHALPTPRRRGQDVAETWGLKTLAGTESRAVTLSALAKPEGCPPDAWAVQPGGSRKKPSQPFPRRASIPTTRAARRGAGACGIRRRPWRIARRLGQAQEASPSP